jgi:hypothetical protein
MELRLRRPATGGIQLELYRAFQSGSCFVYVNRFAFVVWFIFSSENNLTKPVLLFPIETGKMNQPTKL